jgi:hypothetical protein
VVIVLDRGWLRRRLESVVYRWAERSSGWTVREEDVALLVDLLVASLAPRRRTERELAP